MTLFAISSFFVLIFFTASPAASSQNTLGGKTLPVDNDHEFIECHFLRHFLVLGLVYVATSLTEWSCRVKCAWNCTVFLVFVVLGRRK